MNAEELRLLEELIDKKIRLHTLELERRGAFLSAGHDFVDNTNVAGQLHIELSEIRQKIFALPGRR